MVGFEPCPKCGGQFCRHQVGGSAAPTVDPNLAPTLRPTRTPRQQLHRHALTVFDAVDSLVSYRVHQSFNRDRRERQKIDDLRERFALALLAFSRELARQLRRATRSSTPSTSASSKTR